MRYLGTSHEGRNEIGVGEGEVEGGVMGVGEREGGGQRGECLREFSRLSIR